MIADLKPYAEYKESGSKWLGKGEKGSGVFSSRMVHRFLPE